jgi:hypothetical protein
MSITPVYLSIKTINYTDYAGLPLFLTQVGQISALSEFPAGLSPRQVLLGWDSFKWYRRRISGRCRETY